MCSVETAPITRIRARDEDRDVLCSHALGKAAEAFGKEGYLADLRSVERGGDAHGLSRPEGERGDELAVADGVRSEGYAPEDGQDRLGLGEI